MQRPWGRRRALEGGYLGVERALDPGETPDLNLAIGCEDKCTDARQCFEDCESLRCERDFMCELVFCPGGGEVNGSFPNFIPAQSSDLSTSSGCQGEQLHHRSVG